MIFSKTLVTWYLQNKRDLPWRHSNDPYTIWLSEIILQQTRVDQGMAYFFKFIAHFPTVNDLANASEEEVLKLWQGLGYYSRARNLHFSAKYIVNELNGAFPSTYKEVLKLKGVGDYTASAISSICFNERTAVVDGNVYRVLARFFGIFTPINSTAGIKEFKALAQELIDVDLPGTFNQAIMEFGACMCKPQNPDCENCPISDSCVALQKNKIKELPVKINKVKIRNRFFNYIVVHSEDGKTLIEKRNKGIWLNLYQFPLIESGNEIDVDEILNDTIFKDLFYENNFSLSLFQPQSVVHKLSHQHIYAKFWIVKTTASNRFNTSWDEISDFPVSVLIENFLNQYKIN